MQTTISQRLDTLRESLYRRLRRESNDSQSPINIRPQQPTSRSNSAPVNAEDNYPINLNALLARRSSTTGAVDATRHRSHNSRRSTNPRRQYTANSPQLLSPTLSGPPTSPSLAVSDTMPPLSPGGSAGSTAVNDDDPQSFHFPVSNDHWDNETAYTPHHSGNTTTAGRSFSTSLNSEYDTLSHAEPFSFLTGALQRLREPAASPHPPGIPDSFTFGTTFPYPTVMTNGDHRPQPRRKWVPPPSQSFSAWVEAKEATTTVQESKVYERERMLEKAEEN